MEIEGMNFTLFFKNL